MADWKTFQIDLGDVSDALDQVQNVSDALSTLGQLAEAVLNLLRVFTSPSLPNPISAVAQLLIAQLQGLIDNLRDTGAFGLFVVPTTLDDLIESQGGFTRFQQRVVSSFYDTDDIDRPQVGSTGYLGGFVIYVNAPDPSALVLQVISLLRLFGTPAEFKYPAPINVRATPADDQGDASGPLIEGFFTTAQDPLTTILLEWEEPKSTQSLFYDLFAQNKFYIERSKSRNGVLLTRPSSRIQQDPLAKRKAEDAQARGETAEIYREPVLNANREPIYLWEPLDPTNPFLAAVDADEGSNARQITSNFIAGTYSAVVRDVSPGQDNGYYYRIRSVPEDTVLVTRDVQVADGVTPETITTYALELDGEEYTESVPSNPVYGYIPNITFQGTDSFNLPDALLNVYRAAYLLRFDTAVFGTQSQPLAGSDLLTPDIPEYILELGFADFEFEGEGDIREAFESQNPAGFVFTDDEAVRYFSGEFFPGPDEPPGYAASKRFVETVGAVTASDAIEQDPFAGARELFAGALGLSPRQRFRLFVDGVATQKIERIVPLVLRNETLFDSIRQLYTANEASILALLAGFSTEATLKEVTLRNALAQLFVLFDGQIRPGIPPNWESVRLFQDILPGVDLAAQQLLDLITSINLSVGDIGGRFDATIEGLQNRLSVLDAVVDTLDEVIAFLEVASSLSLNASFLFIPPSIGGVSYFVEEFLTATTPPPSLSTDYGAGFVLAAGGPGPDDAQSLLDAIRFVFGV